MHVDLLSGEYIGTESEPPAQSAGSNISSAAVNALVGDQPAHNPQVMQAIADALSGKLPRARDLREGEVEKLHPTHINILFDRAIGYKPGELAVKYGMDRAHVSRVLHHPDAEYLLSLIIGTMADRMSDPRARLAAHANEAVSTVIDVMRKSPSEAVRLKAAQDILARAGYGEQREIKHTGDVGLTMPVEQATGIRQALDESRRVRDLDYRKHMQTSLQVGVDDSEDALVVLPKPQPGQTGAEVAGASPGRRPGSGVVPMAWAQQDPPRLTAVNSAAEDDEERVA